MVAVELPVTLQKAWMRGVGRLPEMSLIFYPDETRGQRQAVYVPVEPADPFTEAIRTGLEIGAEIVFVDPDLGRASALEGRLSRPLRRPPHRPRAIRRGLSRLSAAALGRNSRAHAAGIAWKLQGATRSANVLVVVSLNLLDPVLDAMEEPQAQPPARTPPRRCRAVQSASRFAGRDHASSIRPCNGATKTSAS